MAQKIKYTNEYLADIISDNRSGNFWLVLGTEKELRDALKIIIEDFLDVDYYLLDTSTVITLGSPNEEDVEEFADLVADALCAEKFPEESLLDIIENITLLYFSVIDRIDEEIQNIFDELYPNYANP